MKLSRPYQFAVIGVLVAVYVALRLWRLTDSCLWFDEIFSVHAAEHSWNTLFSFVALDVIHPPLFYVLLKLWIGIGGESLFWLRLFPVIIAFIAIFPFISLCRELKFDLGTRSLAILFLAVNGSLIKYAQELRMYSMLMCFALFSMWLFARYFIKGKSFVPLLIVNILLVYTHYFGWLVVLSEVAAILYFQRIKWRRIVTMLAITLASFVPWILAIWNASRAGSEIGQNIGWMERPGISAITQFKLNLIEPFYYAASSVDPISIYRVSIPLMLIVTVSTVLYIVNWKLRADDEKRAVYLLIIFVMLPIFAAFTASWLLPYSIWGTRHLIIVFAPASILLAIAVTKISNAKIKTAAFTLILLFSAYAFVLQASRETPQYIWCAWEQLAQELPTDQQQNIYVFEDLAAYHIWFATRGQDHSENLIKINKIKSVEGMIEDRAYFLPRGFDVVAKTNFVYDEIFWLIYRADGWDMSKPPLETFNSKDYEIVEQKIYTVADSKIFAVLIMTARERARTQLTREVALSRLKGDCWKFDPLDCTHYAGFLENLYDNGDESLLEPLLDVGETSDGALSAALGPFYADVLQNKTVTFLNALAGRSKHGQEELCFLAIGADGSGNGEPWENDVRTKLSSIANQSKGDLRAVAKICLAQMTRFDKAMEEFKQNHPNPPEQ